MTLHSKIGLGNQHPVHNWEYANAAARNAATGLVAGDVGKIARQLSDNTLWMLTNHSPVTWVGVGGGGGGSLLTSPLRVYVDATNGTDAPTTTGTIGDPFASLAYAAAAQPNPTNITEYGTEVLFHVEPGTYTGDVTLPYRSGIAIQGELVRIVGDILWYQDPAYMFAYPGFPTSEYGRAALKISGSINPLKIEGDIVAQNINPTPGSPVGRKYLLADHVVITGSLMNLAAGASTSADEATGELQTIFDLVQFTGAIGGGHVIFGEGEPGGYGKNAIILQMRNAYVNPHVCGNIELEHIFQCGFYAIDNTVGRPGGVALTSYSGNIGGSNNTGAIGAHYLVGYGPPGWALGQNNAYTIYQLGADAVSEYMMRVLSGGVIDPTLTIVPTDFAEGTYVETSGFVGNLAGIDPDVQSALDAVDALSLGSDAIRRQFWVDATDGSDVTGRGTRAEPYASINAAFADIALDAVEQTYIVEIMAGSYTLTVPLPHKRGIVLRGHGTVAITGDVVMNTEYATFGGSARKVAIIGTSSRLGNSSTVEDASITISGAAAVYHVDASAGGGSVQLTARGVSFTGGMRIEPTGTPGAGTVSMIANVSGCNLGGYTGGTWQGAAVSSNPQWLYLNAFGCTVRDVAGFIVMDIQNSVLTGRRYTYKRNPVSGSTGYSGGLRGSMRDVYFSSGAPSEFDIGADASVSGLVEAFELDSQAHNHFVRTGTLALCTWDNYPDPPYTVIDDAVYLRTEIAEVDGGVTSTYSVTQETATVLCDSDGGAIDVQLPALDSVSHGHIITVKEVGSTVTGGTTITPDGTDVINGGGAGAAYTLSTAGYATESQKYVTLQACNGGSAATLQWHVIAETPQDTGTGVATITWSGQTLDDTPTEIFVGGVSLSRYALTAEQTDAFFLKALARANGTNKSKVWTLYGAASRDGSNNSALVGTVTPTVIAQSDVSGGTDDWDIAVTVDDTDETLRITVTGQAGTTIGWSVSS